MTRDNVEGPGLHRGFDERLRREAEGLVGAGCVSEVRVHQNGGVVTGIVRTEAAAAGRVGMHRVYIRRANGSEQPSAECSCGASGACVHAAAVSIAASRSREETPPTIRMTAPVRPLAEDHSGAHMAMREAQVVRQRLLYLLELDARSIRTVDLGNLQLTVWVSQGPGGGADGSAEAAMPFAPRAVARGRGQYPRYVDAYDEDILEMIRSRAAQGSEGCWHLQGLSGAQLAQRVLRSGRALWRSLQSPPFRAGAARCARLSWRIGAHGEQHLACDVGDSAAALLCLEPPIYVDTASHEWGLVDLPCPQALIHRYAGREISPEEVAEINQRLASEADARAAAAGCRP